MVEEVVGRILRATQEAVKDDERTKGWDWNAEAGAILDMCYRWINKRMKDDKDEKRLEQAALVLQKFGLLPANYDLHAEFLRLMAEQVAAYYDPKTKSVNMLDWLPPDAQKPVLAHEVTHALQDQSYNLEKMSKHDEAIEKRGMAIALWAMVIIVAPISGPIPDVSW